ncbi:GNAT family N-acetyltransferase [Streptomyces sp. NPDC057445]|uniref:GNAT family N-acetyltransferase n=1 Tax=Streptomyces sp. NPDC057445 TaxID=3346136 RepID=UPI0036BEC67C
MEPITLATERLELRTFTPDDAEEVRAACQDPDIQRWIPAVPVPYEREHAEEFVGLTVPDGWRTDTAYTFCVRPLGGGPVLASTSLHHPREGGWEIGFWTAKQHRGHGYATEIVLGLARWAFTELACTRLEWRAEVGNRGSRAVAEKAGFTVEGVQRAGIHARGTLRDCWVASLLPSDLGLASVVPYLPAKV